MEILIDKNLCIRCGLCSSICPEFFKMDEKGEITVENIAENDFEEYNLEEVVESCPEEAISITNN